MKTFLFVMGFIPLGLMSPVIQASQEAQRQWIRPAEKGRLIWGIKGGIVLSIWPSGFHEANYGGPRGLFRLGYERDRNMVLVNFMAVEPVVANKRGFSELEPSILPKQTILPGQKRGKFIWPLSEFPPSTATPKAATVEQTLARSSP